MTAEKGSIAAVTASIHCRTGPAIFIWVPAQRWLHMALPGLVEHQQQGQHWKEHHPLRWHYVKTAWILPPEDEPFPEIQRRKLSSNQI
jgi:hypothetical protein